MDNIEQVLEVETNNSTLPAVEGTEVSELPLSESTSNTQTQENSNPGFNWEEESKRNEKRWHVLQGKYKKANERLEKDNVELKQELQSLRSLIEERFNSEKRREQEYQDHISPEEIDTFIPEHVSIIEKLARKNARQLLRTEIDPLKKELDELRSSHTKVATNLQDSDQNTFLAAVNTVIPDMEDIVADPRWKSYLTTQLPYLDATVGDALTVAHNDRKLNKVVEIFKGFKAKYQNAPGLTGMVSPNLNSSSNRVSEKPKLKWSLRAKAGEDFRRGIISIEKLNEIKAVFEKADKEGRVDYNA